MSPQPQAATRIFLNKVWAWRFVSRSVWAGWKRLWPTSASSLTWLPCPTALHHSLLERQERIPQQMVKKRTALGAPWGTSKVSFYWVLSSGQDELKMKRGLGCMRYVPGAGGCCPWCVGKGMSHTSQKYFDCWIKDLIIMWKVYREESTCVGGMQLCILSKHFFLLFISKCNTTLAPVATRWYKPCVKVLGWLWALSVGQCNQGGERVFKGGGVEFSGMAIINFLVDVWYLDVWCHLKCCFNLKNNIYIYI